MKKRKDNIMIFRVLSCLNVFIVHYIHTVNIQGPIRTITDFGYIAVYFFIVISGYLAFMGYTDQTTTVGYWKKKVVKILPLYYLTIFYYFISHTWFFKDVPADEYKLGWIRYIFCISNIVPASHDFWRNVGMTWTINWILVLYIITPLFHKLVDSFNKALILCTFSYLIYFLRGPMHLFDGWLEALQGLFFYSLGITAYYAIKEGKERLMSGIMVLVAYFFIIQTASRELTGAVLFVILLMATESLELKDGFIKKIFTKLDKYCFEIYLMHGIVFCDVVWRIMGRRGVNSPLIILIVSVGGTATLSVLIKKLLELFIYDRIKYKANFPRLDNERKED